MTAISGPVNWWFHTLIHSGYCYPIPLISMASAGMVPISLADFDKTTSENNVVR